MKALILSTLGLCLAPTALAQEHTAEQIEAQLRRDQQAILRKAERLRDLMLTLKGRYEQENRTRQVELLAEGLQHIEQIGLLATVAGVRDALDARALAQANQKAAKVIRDLEALLQILLDRPSMEKIEEQIKETRKLELDAAALEQRQKELIEKNRETSRSSLNDAERELAQKLRDLARMQEEEATQNMRDAGTRLPFLEDAMRRIDELLRSQQALEDSVRKRREDQGAPDPAQQKMFDLSALKQRADEQLSRSTRQRGMERVAEDAERLQQAVGRKDSRDIQDAKDELRSEVARAAEGQDKELAAKLQELLAKLDAAETAEKLDEVGKQIGQDAKQEADRQREANGKELDELLAEARKTAEKLGGDKPEQPGEVEKRLQEATKAIERAAETGKQQAETQRTQSALSQAMRKLEEARAALLARDPRPDDRAGQMASRAEETARELRRSPGAKPEEQPEPPAENRAAKALDHAEQRLRDAAKGLRAEAEEQATPEGKRATDAELAKARENLQKAREILQKELAADGQDEKAREQAVQRQEQLAEEAQRIRDRMQQAQAGGELSPEQQKTADQQMQQAQRQMRDAQRSLRENRQSQAARQQQDASDSLDKALEEMQRNRPLTPQQREQLQQQAKEQKQLAEDIMRLAKLAEERKSKAAQQALEDAKRAADEAGEKLDQGENDEAEEKQEEAREKLEEAQKDLEEERERYEDLRQEELLFKMQEELKQFLAKQEPITQGTIESGKELAERGRLSRRSRRNLNELGEAEAELGGKAKFLREALEKEAVLVFSHALRANEQDLTEVQGRLAGRNPLPDEVTVVLQKDVEDRTRKLLEALAREQKRRQQQRQEEQQQQEQQQGQNQQNSQNQQRRLVSLIAELEMLKQMEEDMLKRTRFMEKLVATRGDAVSEVDLALLERLAHRHNRITEIFLELKQQVEQAINPPQPAEDGPPEEDKKEGEDK